MLSYPTVSFRERSIHANEQIWAAFHRPAAWVKFEEQTADANPNGKNVVYKEICHRALILGLASMSLSWTKVQRSNTLNTDPI
jgi:hypothetical protein